MNKSSIALFLRSFALIAVLGITSCKKDKETTATVYVIDDQGYPVAGAAVRLFSSPSELPPPPNQLRFDMSSQTDLSGKAVFDFSEFYKKGQAGFAVLDIEASKGSLYGVGIIKIQEEEDNQESIVVE